MSFALITLGMLRTQRDMLHAILYLFDNHISGSSKFIVNEADIADELESEGYALNTIDRTLTWLSNIPKQKIQLAPLPSNKNTLRVFSAEECSKMAAPIRKYILELENSDFITATEREIIISSIMQIDELETIELNQVKRIILLVLFNLADQYRALMAYGHILADENKSIN